MHDDYSPIASFAGAVSDYGRGLDLSAEQKFEDMIEAGWGVMERGFDEGAFLAWRKRAFDYLTEIMGPNHLYTQHFGDKRLQAEAASVLSGTGVLCAAREQKIVSNQEKCKPPALPGVI